MIAPQQEQIVPVRVYQSGERLMAIMPLPGLEPPDISVTVRGDEVVVRGEYRGPHQQDLDLLIAEWAIGPYHRELHLPQAVDGARTNATYGNGVLVLVMPRLAQGERHQDTEFRLEVLAAARGAHVGHTGHDLHQTTMAEHRQRQEQAEQAAHATTTPGDSGSTRR